ncbi:hypothetical protein OPV22_032550 [Ensete ventricosum]|uniref:Reverse transcriptase Ty1/copia-type domain-containing protein n=1 Tax=Ensete ventricosum TaxID=4639 RepID=A0AAV8PL16_ENSVE|nr:hypothetical protein OPV22_032550 [Ensete ventricosum]
MSGLSQFRYIDSIVKRFGIENFKRGLIPMRHEISLSRSMSPKTPEERADMDKIPYALAIGSIMYVMLCTRPDIAHALSVTSKYQADPGLEHWKAVKCILKYLRRTKDLLLVYGGGSLQVEGYIDSSFQSDIDDSKSNSSDSIVPVVYLVLRLETPMMPCMSTPFFDARLTGLESFRSGTVGYRDW